MAKTKYNKIYHELKMKIENEEYRHSDLIPSESVLVAEYDCSRNTVRRAISELVSLGYLQSIKGKGVRVIYQPDEPSFYSLGKIESFKEAAIRNRKNVVTKILLFKEITVDEQLHKKVPFEVGAEVYYLQRLRFIDGKASTIDHNYFLKSVMSGFNQTIAEHSIYEYLEDILHVEIVSTRRIVKVKRINKLDEENLELNGANCVAAVENYTYNSDGIMFEFTESRHTPDDFVFYDRAHRVKELMDF